MPFKSPDELAEDVSKMDSHWRKILDHKNRLRAVLHIGVVDFVTFSKSQFILQGNVQVNLPVVDFFLPED
jgi:hypothetical protein